MEGYYDPDPVRPGKTIARRGGFVSGVEEFDAGFFGISGAEAARMDPQQRLLLQTVWHAVEHGGQDPQELRGSDTAVFVGVTNTNTHLTRKLRAEGLTGLTGYDATSDATSVIAGRVASFFGLQGPCLSVDTACSSSLVGVHLARQSILSGECDTAIVAGINLMLYPAVDIAFSKAGLLSPNGQCRAFDAAADGYVRSEGCVAVVLRRQTQAVARGDRILASLLGTAVNHHGRSVRFTAPDRHTQRRVMRSALTQADVHPNQIGYVDAHGTGTPVGDPVEMSSIVDVFGGPRASGHPLYVGSAKSNFGHLEAGAGLLGLVKSALSLHEELIFPSIHFDELNPKIDLQGNEIRVPTSPLAWPRTEVARTSSVNSFGYSGTNASAVLREAPPSVSPAPAADAPPYELLVLSAKSAERLHELAGRWADHLAEAEPTSLPDAAFTAAVGRAQLRHRLAVVGATPADTVATLRRWRDRRGTAFAVDGQARHPARVTFVFTGQGAQYPGMGTQLYAHAPVFAAAIDQCAAIMDSELGEPLHDVIFGGRSDEAADDTALAQPALFAIEYALAELLRSWGIQPALVTGHSVGEIAAACVSGLITVEEAARFSVLRGRLMGALPRLGKMLAIAASEDLVRSWLEGRTDVAISAVNGPRSVVVSGTAATVDTVGALAEESGVRTTPLKVSHAFHSPLMEPVLAELEEFAATFRRGQPTIPMVSGRTGTFMTGDEGPDYWSRQARDAVRFDESVRTAIEAGCSSIVEVGPHPALAPVITGALGATDTRLVTTLQRDGADVLHMVRAAGTLFTTGASIAGLFTSAPGRRVSAPLYPFRRDRYWFDPAGSAPSAPVPDPEPGVAPPQSPGSHANAAVALAEEGRTQVGYETTVTTSTPWSDHRVLGKTVIPASGYLEFAARACATLDERPEPRHLLLRDIDFFQPLALAPGQRVAVEVRVNGVDEHGSRRFAIEGRATNQRTVEYCRGVAETLTDTLTDIDGDRLRLDDLRAQMTDGAPGPFYGLLREMGLEYGANFSTVRELWTGPRGGGESLGRIRVAPDGTSAEDHEFRLSTVLDGCLHMVAAALSTLDRHVPDRAYVPVRLNHLKLVGPLPAQVWSHVRVRLNDSGAAAIATLRIADDDGALLAEMVGVELRPVESLTNNGRETVPRTSQQVGISRAELVARLQPRSRVERLSLVTQWVVNEVRETLGQLAVEYEYELDVDQLDPSAALLEIGLDSLMVTEFQRRIQEKLEFRFAAMEAVEYQSMADLAEYLLDHVLASSLEKH